MTFQLRRAAIGDHERLRELLREGRDAQDGPIDPRELPLHLHLHGPDRHAYVFGECGAIDGVALLRDPDPHGGDVIDVAAFHVHAAARRRGLGRRASQVLRQHYPQAWRVQRPKEDSAEAAFWRSVAPPAALPTGRGKPSTDLAPAPTAWLLLPPSFGAEAALGPPAGSIRLAAHTPAWAALYAQEQHRIETALARLVREVQHIGSTAVPNLHAVPTIDMVVGVDAGTLSASLDRLQAIGYREGGRSFERNGYLLEKQGARGRTHSLHLLPWTAQQCPDSVLARDHLRTNVAARAEYQVIRRHLALAHPRDLRTYAKAKTAALAALVTQARARRAVLAKAGFAFPPSPQRPAMAG